MDGDEDIDGALETEGIALGAAEIDGLVEGIAEGKEKPSSPVPPPQIQHALGAFKPYVPVTSASVSYTHLRAHET